MDEIETKSASAVAAILGGAGWKADPGWGGFTHGTCVGGLAPDGNAYVKNWAAIGPDHPKYSADTPDTAEEAAQWLADRYKPNPLTTEATLDPVALQREEVENPGDESNGETGEASGDGESASELVFEPSDEGDAERVDLFDSESVPVEPLDAEFTEGEDLGSELLDVELEGDDFAELNRRADAALLDAPLPEDFAPEDFAHEPEPEAPQDRFIGLDDLDRVRSLRIGDVATEALRLTTLIERAVSEQEGEFSNIQAYVVSNLDKHTGAFTPQDDASRATYGRFLELSSARSKIAKIDARRKDATAFLIAAGRDDVVSFDVRAAFA